MMAKQTTSWLTLLTTLGFLLSACASPMPRADNPDFAPREPIGLALHSDEDPPKKAGFGMVLLSRFSELSVNKTVCNSFKTALTAVRPDLEQRTQVKANEDQWVIKLPVYWPDQRPVRPHSVMTDNCRLLLLCYDFPRAQRIGYEIERQQGLEGALEYPLLAAFRREDARYFTWDISDLPTGDIPRAIRKWYHALHDPTHWDKELDVLSFQDKISLFFNRKGKILVGSMNALFGTEAFAADVESSSDGVCQSFIKPAS